MRSNVRANTPCREVENIQFGVRPPFPNWGMMVLETEINEKKGKLRLGLDFR